jgi:hypothetical protein
MPARRTFHAPEHSDLLRLVRRIAAEELAPGAAKAEAEERLPRDVFRILGQAGLLGLPYPEEVGGGGLPYEVYLQVLEEVSAVWASLAVGISVHALFCFGLATRGTTEQQRWLPGILAGQQLGAYCLSEAHAGSDPAAVRATERREGDEYILSGTKAWVTYGGEADFYKIMARTSGVPGDAQRHLLLPRSRRDRRARRRPARTQDAPTGSTTASLILDDVRVPVKRRLGEEGYGLKIALSGLDAGRLGIAAVATGLAQSALDAALAYAQERTTFAQRIIDHQGIGFLLADMEAAVVTARATTLHAARLKDAGVPFSREASIAKLTVADSAMMVTTDAVQILGGSGYTRDFPVERFMREAKVMQIFEGTNQIQRLVISRHLDRDNHGAIAAI